MVRGGWAFLSVDLYGDVALLDGLFSYCIAWARFIL